jgi:RNA polymerase sigma-70 factor, ECF subfamily
MTDWNTVVREHGPLVWRVAFRLLGNEADAADCFQRVFVSALESSTPGVRDWPALLRRVATNRALEQLRERYRRAARAGPLPDAPLADDHAVDPLDTATGEELASRLREALARIDPRQAEVFCLASLEGWSYPDISAQLGVTANHVGVLLNRARAALRDQLRAFDPARRNHHEREGQPWTN